MIQKYIYHSHQRDIENMKMKTLHLHIYKSEGVELE